MRALEFLATLAAAAFVLRSVSIALKSGEKIDVREPDAQLPMLSILVPARNEERQIEQCIRSLLAQRYPLFEVIVINDRSDDRTGAILAGVASSDSRLTVVHGDALPGGWVGKPWALAQGARIARGEWLIFTDADTTHEPHAAASAIGYALDNALHAVSLLTTQRMETIAERSLLPTILWMIAFAVGSLDAINDPKRTDAAIFNGQFIAIERASYDALGGHASVKGAIAEDYEFARLLKRDGRFYARLVGANDLVYTRMYQSFTEIWHGFTKNLYAGAIHAPALGAAGALWLALLSPLPEMLLARALFRRRSAAAASMFAVIVSTAAAAEFGMRRSRFPHGSGAFFPVGAATMLAIFGNSVLRHRRGRIEWRGRTYAGERTTPPGSQT